MPKPPLHFGDDPVGWDQFGKFTLRIVSTFCLNCEANTTHSEVWSSHNLPMDWTLRTNPVHITHFLELKLTTPACHLCATNLTPVPPRPPRTPLPRQSRAAPTTIKAATLDDILGD